MTCDEPGTHGLRRLHFYHLTRGGRPRELTKQVISCEVFWRCHGCHVGHTNLSDVGVDGKVLGSCGVTGENISHVSLLVGGHDDNVGDEAVDQYGVDGVTTEREGDGGVAVTTSTQLLDSKKSGGGGGD
ncbi:hypothetical protein Pcinc_004816 [Petrolisthes cinctipes]|uniref:Uncharacterized protein n=1 Tax=Petrolisthes cinctipes TaxID=88211 RepID=A0AAE1GGB7_PETCI|nr:hypothetical protein Pcinc_004816 [Petrolisthes cinctipes]